MPAQLVGASLLKKVAWSLVGEDNRRIAPPTRGGATLDRPQATFSTDCNGPLQADREHIVIQEIPYRLSLCSIAILPEFTQDASRILEIDVAGAGARIGGC